MGLKDYSTEELKEEIFRRFHESRDEILVCAIYTKSTIEARLNCNGRGDLAANKEFIDKVYNVAKYHDFQGMLMDYENEEFSMYDHLIDIINEEVDEYDHSKDKE